VGHPVTESEGSRQVPVVLATKPLDGDIDAQPAVPARSPEVAAFSEIFTGQFRYVYNTLKRLGVKSGDLEDSTHDAFLCVYRHLADWDRTRPLRPWLFAFAYRTASAYRRQARHRREVVDSTYEAQAPDRDSLERLVDAQQLALVQAALLTVDLEHRAVFILHDLDETPMPETARSLGIALNTGYSRLRAARRKFETALKLLQQQGGK
jgi:RNA polymerase sigma-70 factor, ECF subfamily